MYVCMASLAPRFVFIGTKTITTSHLCADNISKNRILCCCLDLAGRPLWHDPGCIAVLFDCFVVCLFCCL
jgi:hypothetical protein